MRRNFTSSDSYKFLAKKVRLLLKTAREEYYVSQLCSLNHDLKRNWRVLNSLMGRNKKSSNKSFKIDGSTTDDPTTISNSFCEHFIDHPKNIHESIPLSNSHHLDLVSTNQNSMFFNPTTTTEVIKSIMSLNKEGGLKDVSRKFLLLCNLPLSHYLMDLFNLCISIGTYPDVFKIAQITPIHKKGSIQEIPNYRPISVLCNLSKIFENLIYERIQKFCQSSNFLAENQFGFRKNRNTELAAFNLMDKLLHALEDQKYAICVFLDTYVSHNVAK